MPRNLSTACVAHETLDVLRAKLLAIGIDFDSDEWLLSRDLESLTDPPIRLRWTSILKRLPVQNEGPQPFRTTLKRAAAVWLAGGTTLPRRLTSATIRQRVHVLRRFLVLMLDRGVTDLELITAKRVQNLLVESYRTGSKGLSVTCATVMEAMRTVHELYLMGSDIGSNLMQPPFPTVIRKRIARKFRSLDTWEAPPEPVCMRLLGEAIRLIGVPADDLIRIINKYGPAVEEGRSKGISDKMLGPYAKRVLHDEKFTVVPGEEEPWTDVSPLDLVAVAGLVRRLQAACYIAIAFTSGPRVSEIRRARPGSVRMLEHQDGSKYVYYIAQRSKQRHSDRQGQLGDEHRWVLSPAGDRAMRVLDALSAKLRERSGVQSYWVSFSGSGLWPRDVPKKGFHILGEHALNERLNALAEFLKLSETTGWSGRLHTHMGRKCTARFVAMRDRRALGDLALQFSHLSSYSVDVGYARPDSEYRRLVRQELASEFEQMARTIARLPPQEIYHAMNEDTFVQWHGKVTSLVGRAHTRDDVLRLIGKGSQIFPGLWGGCAYRAATSACKGGPDGPNPALKSPMTCSLCVNFRALPEHAEWWRIFHEECERYLSLSGIPRQSRLIVEERLKRAEDVLRRIDTTHSTRG